MGRPNAAPGVSAEPRPTKANFVHMLVMADAAARARQSCPCTSGATTSLPHVARRPERENRCEHRKVFTLPGKITAEHGGHPPLSGVQRPWRGGGGHLPARRPRNDYKPHDAPKPSATRAHPGLGLPTKLHERVHAKLRARRLRPRMMRPRGRRSTLQRA